MRLELVFYRLMIVVVVAFALGFGSVWAYQTKQANDWQSLVTMEHEHMKEMAADCEKEGNRMSACEFYASSKVRFESAVQERDAATESAALFGMLAVAVPLLVALLFYSLRWSVTGKLRPLRPT